MRMIYNSDALPMSSISSRLQDDNGENGTRNIF